ncbi:MAG: CinA family nicotinamide mononucleotide deamidase-related protein [Candidatus Neomarinimicrobiota bacterium]|nr:MAG: CinA family nicotinamide mononucleotide deamidase-related protein [Candidatus Neomarinimicrobiota bacterium]
MLTALGEASQLADAVITTGGLGPTHDDVTATAFYRYFQDEPIFDKVYWQELESRFGRMGRNIPAINKDQALRPRSGETIPNAVGTARGLHYERESCHYFCLPGVPREMKAMMTQTVLPWIQSHSRQTFFVKTLRTTGIPESALAEKLAQDLHVAGDQVEVAFLPQMIGVDLRLTGPTQAHVEAVEHRIWPTIERYVYGTGEDRLETVLGRQLQSLGLTLAVAESCTGGLLSHRITNSPGSSAYFLGGMVTYSNQLKEELLGVRHETLEVHGAVSEPTAREMAEGIRARTGADLGIGITGIAGPGGGTPEKPVGLVYIGLAVTAGTIAKRFEFSFDRETNKLVSTQAALNMIRKWLHDRG